MREGSLSKRRGLVVIQTRARLNYNEGSFFQFNQKKKPILAKLRITHIPREFDIKIMFFCSASTRQKYYKSIQNLSKSHSYL